MPAENSQLIGPVGRELFVGFGVERLYIDKRA
jgi:hypothetical protein